MFRVRVRVRLVIRANPNELVKVKSFSDDTTGIRLCRIDPSCHKKWLCRCRCRPRPTPTHTIVPTFWLVGVSAPTPTHTIQLWLAPYTSLCHVEKSVVRGENLVLFRSIRASSKEGCIVTYGLWSRGDHIKWCQSTLIIHNTSYKDQSQIVILKFGLLIIK